MLSNLSPYGDHQHNIRMENQIEVLSTPLSGNLQIEPLVIGIKTLHAISDEYVAITCYNMVLELEPRHPLDNQRYLWTLIHL